jgi:urease accessory protein
MIAKALARPAIAAGAVAIASIFKIPGNDDDVAAVRLLANTFRGEVAASAWNGHAVVRLVAPDSAALRQDLMAVLTALTSQPLPRLWSN